MSIIILTTFILFLKLERACCPLRNVSKYSDSSFAPLTYIVARVHFRLVGIEPERFHYPFTPHI